MKSTILWDITPCSPLKVNRRFGVTSPSSSVESQPTFRRNMTPPSELCLPPDFTLVSCSAYFSTLKMEAMCSSETSFGFRRTTRRYIPEDTLHVISLLDAAAGLCVRSVVESWGYRGVTLFTNAYTTSRSWGGSVGESDFSLLHSVETGSAARPASSPMGTGSSFPGGKPAELCSWPLTSTQCRGQ
jgi:hypothetical protein